MNDYEEKINIMYITTIIVALSLTAQFMPYTMMDPPTWITVKDMATRKVGSGSKPVRPTDMPWGNAPCPEMCWDSTHISDNASEWKGVPVHNTLSAI